MMMYCRTCHRTHRTWIRLNNGVICGRCGARVTNARIVPFNKHEEPARPSLLRLKPA